MLVAECSLDRRQAIIAIGLQPDPLAVSPLGPTTTPLRIALNSYRALIDTGAQQTCLTNRTIVRERLRRHGHQRIRNVHSEQIHSRHLVVIGIWGRERESPGDRARSYYGIPDPLRVINIADNDRFDAILGMDVLERFDFSFHKSGRFEMILA